MSCVRHHTVAMQDSPEFEAHVARLTPSQKPFVDALRDFVRQPTNRLVIVSGGPGSGKTFTVIETLKFTRLKVIRMAPTARIAQKIGGNTIHSTLKLPWGAGTTLHELETRLAMSTDVAHCIAQSRVLSDIFDVEDRKKVDIVVVDEIGMVPFWLAHSIVRYFYTKVKRPVMIVMMGDRNQLKPVRSQYNVFGVDLDMESTTIEMKESRRFTPAYKAIVDELKRYVDRNDPKELIEYVKTAFPVVAELDEALLTRCNRALAYKNATVDNLNEFYIDRFRGERVRCVPYDRVKGEVVGKDFFYLKTGCDVVVTANCNFASNGTPLVFDEYDRHEDVLVCRDPQIGTRVHIERSLFNHRFPVVPRFAGTVHKYQGDTIDEKGVVFHFNGCLDVNLIYTALSRVRSMDQILAVVL